MKYQCAKCRRLYVRKGPEPLIGHGCPRPECEGARLMPHQPAKRIVRGARPKPRGKRPHCLGCGVELRPNFRTLKTSAYEPGRSRHTVVEWTGHYGVADSDLFHSQDCGDLFHSQDCGFWWAVRTARL